ncbi:NAD(P)H-binding protein [Leifsonia sp. NPDC080035]|uniref:NAD(P)H-binding protein n=1 Tax=Leifsonia sp. NPDC080035 TaxID=3143936 RepID=A0AAU7GHT0_9MICO
MTIAVTTPTGNVGRHLLRLVVQAGERPRVLVRDPERLDEAARGFVDAVATDQLDTESVVRATAGVEAVHWIVPPSGLDDPLEGYRRATDALLAAVRENGIRRVVFQSSSGAERRHGAGEIDGLAATEVALDDAGVDVTHLRCGYFFSNLLFDLDSLKAGTIATAFDVDAPMPWVAPEDIAAVAAVRLLDRSWSGRHVQAVHGPEDLSFRDVAAIVGDAVGRPIDVVQLGDDDVRATLTAAGMTPAQVEALVGMTAGIRDGYTPENPRDYTTTTPTTLAGWVPANLVPLLR